MVCLVCLNGVLHCCWSCTTNPMYNSSWERLWVNVSLLLMIFNSSSYMSCWSFSNRDVLLLIYIFWNSWEGLLCKVVICILADTCFFFNYLCWEKLYSIWSRTTSLIVYAFEKNMWWVDTFSAVMISTFLSWSREMLCC